MRDISFSDTISNAIGVGQNVALAQAAGIALGTARAIATDDDSSTPVVYRNLMQPSLGAVDSVSAV